MEAYFFNNLTYKLTFIIR